MYALKRPVEAAHVSSTGSHDGLIQENQARARDKVGPGDTRDVNTCSLFAKGSYLRGCQENFSERIFFIPHSGLDKLSRTFEIS